LLFCPTIYCHWFARYAVPPPVPTVLRAARGLFCLPVAALRLPTFAACCSLRAACHRTAVLTPQPVLGRTGYCHARFRHYLPPAVPVLCCYPFHCAHSVVVSGRYAFVLGRYTCSPMHLPTHFPLPLCPFLSLPSLPLAHTCPPLPHPHTFPFPHQPTPVTWTPANNTTHRRSRRSMTLRHCHTALHSDYTC